MPTLTIVINSSSVPMELWRWRHAKMVCCLMAKAPFTITATTTGRQIAETVKLTVREKTFKFDKLLMFSWLFRGSRRSLLHPRLWISIRSLRSRAWMLETLHQVWIWSSTPRRMHQRLGLRRQNPRLQLAWSLVGKVRSKRCRRFPLSSQSGSKIFGSPFLAFPSFLQPLRPSQFLPLHWRKSTIDPVRRREILRPQHFDLRRCWVKKKFSQLSFVNYFFDDKFPLHKF